MSELPRKWARRSGCAPVYAGWIRLVDPPGHGWGGRTVDGLAMRPSVGARPACTGESTGGGRLAPAGPPGAQPNSRSGCLTQSPPRPARPAGPAIPGPAAWFMASRGQLSFRGRLAVWAGPRGASARFRVMRRRQLEPRCCPWSRCLGRRPRGVGCLPSRLRHLEAAGNLPRLGCPQRPPSCPGGGAVRPPAYPAECLVMQASVEISCPGASTRDDAVAAPGCIWSWLGCNNGCAPHPRGDPLARARCGHSPVVGRPMSRKDDPAPVAAGCRCASAADRCHWAPSRGLRATPGGRC